MSGNKYLQDDRSTLLRNKLEKLAINLSSSLGSSGLATVEQYIFETIKVIGEYYKSLNEPRISQEEIAQVRVDDLPDPALFNFLWNEILDDLTVVFSELENVEALTIANFNYIATESNRLTSRLKSVFSKVGDFVLYTLNPIKDSFYFKDSFNDLSKIDNNSPLLNTPQCDINQAEGIIILPIDRTKDSFVLIKETPLINPNSNGVAGNNQEIGRPYNGSLTAILDNNPDTWFEFERVVLGTTDNKEPLVLDITINLGEARVINHIRVNPNNFGTKTVIQIQDISTSTDGRVYTSVKDDIPIAGFTTEDEENIFNLAPSTSKFAGQGLYTFTPRKAKYIHCVFKQSEPYIIQTNNGERLRYAIGIRDIDIRGYSYLNTGEIVSRPFELLSQVRKVLLQANQNPTTLSELAQIEYSISPDGGASWYRIQPKDLESPTGIQSIPEILNLNSSDPDSINTSVPANTIRLKVRLVRNDDAFTSGSSTFQKTVEPKAEVHGIPQAAPFTIALLEPPVNKTVQVIDPLFGSRGKADAPYILGHAQDKIDNRKYRLPFTRLPRPLKKVLSSGAYHTLQVPASEWSHVSVGGEEWSQATKPISQYNLDFQNLQNFKIYNLDINRGILEFGDGLTNTLGPGSDQPIAFWMDAERLFPSETTNNHTAQLEFFTSNTKEDMTIKRYDIIETVTEILPRRATIIRLENENLVDISSIETQFGGGNKKTFINGIDELLTDNDWSIDTELGVIYLKTPTSGTTEISITYTYQPIYELSTDDWDWATTSVLRDSIAIKDSTWKTRTVEALSLPTDANLRAIDLAHFSVVKGTLKFNLAVGSSTPDISINPFLKEVDFVNGVQELGGQVRQTTELISNGLTSAADGIVSFSLRENISTNTQHKLVFSNTTAFATQRSTLGAVTSNGDWFVQQDAGEADYGTVYVMVDNSPSSGTPLVNPGTIMYYFSAPGTADSGLYSVDYKLGKIYLQRPLDPDNDDNWVLSATYQYTDFRAEYRIARLLDPTSYDVDITEQTVTIKDSEALKYQHIPHSVLNTISPFYIVTYDRIVESREDIEELRDLFSPVVKDYALRVLTRDSII